MTTFHPRDPQTWPALLTTDHLAAIYGRSRKAIESRMYRGTWRVKPIEQGRRGRGTRLEFRAADVERDVFGEPATAIRSAVTLRIARGR